MKPTAWLFCAGLFLAGVPAAAAGEICGNKIDDDGDGLTDEGCYAALRTGLCESPLSCADTGWVSWSTGSLHYELPPDVAPRSPYGPGIELRRFYTSMYSPPATPSSFNRTPLGNRWQHTYMSWIDPAPGGAFVIHTPQGDDLMAYAGGEGDMAFHALQPGKGPYAWMRERWNAGAGAIEYELRTKTGEVLMYNSAGQLYEIHDTVAPPNTGKVRLTWTSTSGGSAVGTVTDATQKRRLSFSYTGSLLTSVRLQLAVSGTWTTFHTTTYAYAAGNLTSVTIGGQLAQTNVHTNGLLTQIKDGDNKQIVAFKYSATRPGEANLVDTADGTLGFEFDSTRSACLDQTVLYFNKGSASSCSTDGDCGSGLLCGGKTGDGPTGTCFRAARCLTLDPASGEGLVTSVRALGPPSEPCTGACAETAQYAWNTAYFGTLDLKATRDALGGFTTVRYDVNGFGMPTQINYADTDSDPENGGGARTAYLFYDGNHAGRIREVRRATNVGGGESCSDASIEGCARTLYEYDPATGKLARTVQSGWTLDGGGNLARFSYTTTRTYDARGRLTSIDGPLDGPGDHDVTTFAYHSSDDPLLDGFLHSHTRHSSLYWTLTEHVSRYDFWGNAIDWLEVDGTRSCRTYDTARNYLAGTSEEMGGTADSSCAADHPSDIIERYTRDSALRLTRAQSGDGSCIHYEYDGKGRLARTKRRDDCRAASSGDREEYVYDHDGLLTAVDTYDAAGVVTHQTAASYHDSRRQQAVVNPVDTTKLQAFSYDERGVLTAINDEGGLGRTTYSVDADYRATILTRRTTATTWSTWTLAPDSLGRRASVTDPDGVVLETTYDDLGRLVRQGPPEEAEPPEETEMSTYSYTPGGRIRTSARALQSREFTYDSLGRLLTADYEGRCHPSSLPEITNYWDIAPWYCPIAGGCQNLMGRVAATRVTLLCDSTLTDGALHQWTYYSYDAAGRVIAEHISDNNERVATQTYAWTKADEPAQVTLPSSTVLGWTYGSTASNSDTDLLTGQWRTSPAAPVTANILWNPYGPLKQYDRMDVISGSALRMRLEYNLAYRPTSVNLEGQTFGGPYYRLALAEDAKGRITKRDYYPSDPQMAGVFDSYFRYDHQDHLLCETTSPVANCPSTASNIIKNSHPAGLTAAGDRTTLLRPIPGSASGMSNIFTFGFGNHRISRVQQSFLGTTDYGHDGSSGNRLSESNAGPLTSHSFRGYTYDGRGNVIRVRGTYPIGGEWHGYVVRSAFDGRNRRVFKSFDDQVTGKRKHWFFYYDALDRLTEVRYIPDASVRSVFTTYQLFWLEDLLTAYWQTESPSGVTTKRYVASDETGRPVRMHSWETGNSRVVWAIDPDAWGMDRPVIGQDVYQPIVFAGQYLDSETASFLNDGVTVNRPGLVLNGFRTYDPFTGSYLQVDPLLNDTWSAYGYADGNPVGWSDPSGAAIALPARKAKTGFCWSWSSKDGWDFPDVAPLGCWTPLSEPLYYGGGAMASPGGRGSGKGKVEPRKKEKKKPARKKPVPKEKTDTIKRSLPNGRTDVIKVGSMTFGTPLGCLAALTRLVQRFDQRSEGRLVGPDWSEKPDRQSHADIDYFECLAGTMS